MSVSLDWHNCARAMFCVRCKCSGGWASAGQDANNARALSTSVRCTFHSSVCVCVCVCVCLSVCLSVCLRVCVRACVRAYVADVCCLCPTLHSSRVRVRVWLCVQRASLCVRVCVHDVSAHSYHCAVARSDLRIVVVRRFATSL